MNASMIVLALTTAVSIGLGCGTCCSPIISTFLSSYVVSHSGGVKKGVLSFLIFFFGKMCSVSMLCIVSAVTARQFIGRDGMIGSFNLRLFSQAAMSAIGVFLSGRWILEWKAVGKKHQTCGGCKECGKQKGKAGVVPMFAAGLTYGITPCAPLLLMIGYCFSQPVPLAGMAGMAFSLSSMVSPVLLLVIVTGALSKKMGSEIPDTVKWFRLASYLLLMVMPFLLTVE
ncbi:sulfite exporter TauE/SafE family protein [Lachnospiraceae bacterium 47-T17]